MTKRTRRFLFLTLPLIVAVAHACNSPVEGGDSESHFLGECVATCSSGLSCVCGVCTRHCAASSECSALSGRAECTTALEPACAASGKTCDVACLSDDACTSLGHGYGCVGGRCRSLANVKDASVPGLHDGSPGTGGSMGRDATPTSGCGHATFPPPPDPASITTPGGDREMVVAMAKVVLGDAEDDPSNHPTEFLNLGFDIDNKCTTLSTRTTAAECHIPSFSHGAVDGPEGRDNTFGQIFQFTRNVLKTMSSENYSRQLRNGVTNLIVRVNGYNGELNDDQVTVTTFMSAPFDSAPRTRGTVPKWDGQDVWPVASDSYKPDGKTPRYVDSNAYVTGGRIVVTLPEADLRLVVGLSAVMILNLDLSLHGTFLVCDLNQTAVGHWGWTLQNCALGASLRADDLIHQLSHFGDPGKATGQPLCRDSQLYPTFKTNICALVDVNETGLPSPGTDCDSLSVGLSFDTEPALIGDAFLVNPVGELCPPGTQPAQDSCERVEDGGGAGGSGGAAGVDAAPSR